MTTYNLDIIIKAIDQASANLRTVGGSLGTLGQEASSAAQSLRPLGVGLAAVGVAGSALIATSTMAAARVEELGIVLETVGANAGYTTTELAAYEAGVKGLGITTQAARQALTQMAQANIDLASSTDLARLAQDAAVIAQVDSSEAFTRLITIIQTGNVLMGRRLGLNLDFAASNKRLADTLGITTQELTAEQRIQARLNEVMRQGVAITGTYEAAMGTAGKQLRSLNRHFEEAGVALGQAYLPALGQGVQVTQDILVAFNQLDPAQQRAIANFVGVGTAVTAVTGAGILLLPQILAIGSSLGTVATMAGGTVIAFGSATAALSLFAGGASMAEVATLGLAGVIGGAVLPLTLFAAAMAGVIYVAQQIPETMKRSTESVIGLGEASIWFEGVGADLEAGMREIEVATSDLTDGWTGQYSPALIEARKLTDGWNTSLELARQPLEVLTERVGEATTEVLTYTDKLGMLKEALEGPVSAANEGYIAEQERINAEVAEAKARLIELGSQHGNYDAEVAETQATLESLEGELVSLDAQHRAVMNQIVYDMMMARLATEGWTAAETELALETARAMGIIDEETWAAATNMNAALDSFAEGASVANTVGAILGIGGELSGLEPIADAAGAGIGASISSGAAAGASAIDKITGAIGRIPRNVRVNVVTHYSSTGGGPGRGEATGEEGYQYGTDYVPRTGWAYLHRGEAVLPVPAAAQYRAGDTNIKLTANYAYQSERRLRDDVRMMQLLAAA